MVWANADLVGCARVWNPQARSLRWSYSLICNYGSTSGAGSNLIGQSVYIKGDACSDCPSGFKCETGKYPALCGNPLTAHSMRALAIESGQPNQISISPFVIAAFLVMMLFF